MTNPTSPTESTSHGPIADRKSDQERLAALFALSREVTGVLDLDELLARIPRLIARLTDFGVFSVYLLDDATQMLRIAYAEGYPEEVSKKVRLALGQGTVGTAVQEQRSILLNDVSTDPRYISVVPGVQSTLVVPLRHKGKAIGALNLLSNQKDAFDDTDESMLSAFGASVAQAIVNARLFESEREYSDTMETLAEVGREMSAILDLDELLTRVAHLVKRVIDYRTFGIALVNDVTGMVEFKVAISYGEASASSAVRVGEGLLGYAVQHKEVVLVPDVTQDPRYINAVPDARSELVVPLLVKDRCIGAFDLESPELNAFSKRHVELLTLLASEAAVAIENARLWETVRANEERIEKELRFAQRVQVALLPQELPKRLRAVDVSWRFEPARELGGDLYDFLAPEANQFIVAVGDVSGKGVPAALYSVFAVKSCAAAPSAAGSGKTVTIRVQPRFSRRSTGSCTSGSWRSTTARSATRSSISGSTRSRWPTQGCRSRSAVRPRAASARKSHCRVCPSDRLARPPTTRSWCRPTSAMCSPSAPTASRRRSARAATSSDPAASPRSCARIATRRPR